MKTLTLPRIPILLLALVLLLNLSASQPTASAIDSKASSTEQTINEAQQAANEAQQTISEAPQTTSEVQQTPTDIISADRTALTDRTSGTYVYISCPIEIYRGTLYENQPAEQLVDDFDELPEHWLYVLTPLADDEEYIFTLDLASRTQNSSFEGDIVATYHNYIPDDGTLGTLRIEATEEIAPDVFNVYYGEIKYISDGTLILYRTSDANIYAHHLFYFTLTTSETPPGDPPFGEQRISRLDTSSVSANVTIIGESEGTSSVYDEDLLQSDYMYPYHKYDPASDPWAPVNPEDTFDDDPMSLTGGRHFVDDSYYNDDTVAADNNKDANNATTPETPQPESPPTPVEIIPEKPIIPGMPGAPVEPNYYLSPPTITLSSTNEHQLTLI